VFKANQGTTIHYFPEEKIILLKNRLLCEYSPQKQQLSDRPMWDLPIPVSPNPAFNDKTADFSGESFFLYFCIPIIKQSEFYFNHR
jgi:hypothetical protein